MPAQNRIRRRLAAVVLAALTLVATACSSTDTAEPQAASKDSAFPVTLTHAFGTTELTAKPERIVVIGFKEQDYYLALGTVPVAIRDWYGDMPSATWPWAQSYLKGQKPTVLPRAELDYEQIIGLDPDVIVGMSAGLTQEEYDTLSKIAPTVAQPDTKDQWAVTWQQMAKTAGAITGKSAEAAKLTSDLEKRLASVKTEHPELAGASSVFASGWEGQYYVYSPAATGSQVLLSLGLTMSDEVTKLTDNSNQYVVISKERFDLLDVKVAIWSESAQDDIMAALLKNPLYTDRPVRKEGRDLFLGKEANGALSFSSVLSLPYLIDNVVPAIVQAADGDPATKSKFTP